MDLARCILGKFSIVPTFVARCIDVCTDAREPSGDGWNYLSKRLSSNFAEMTASTPFRYMFLAINLRQRTDCDI
jgi:hypothetical protein